MRAATDPAFAAVLKSFLNDKALGRLSDDLKVPVAAATKYPELATFASLGELRNAVRGMCIGNVPQRPKVRKLTPTVAAGVELPPESTSQHVAIAGPTDCPFTSLFNLGFLGEEELGVALKYQLRDPVKTATALDFAKFLTGAIQEKQFKASDALKADFSDAIMWHLVTRAPRRAIAAAAERLGTDPTDLTSVLTAVSAKPIAEHAELIAGRRFIVTQDVPKKGGVNRTSPRLPVKHPQDVEARVPHRLLQNLTLKSSQYTTPNLSGQCLGRHPPHGVDKQGGDKLEMLRVVTPESKSLPL